jgi:formate/nitrite transporter FocA (FNT family)
MANAKLALRPVEALFRGVLCNMLVCLAVWMSLAARRASGKVLVVLLPIAAFVAVGFEHSVANMYVVPVAMLSGIVEVDPAGFLRNLAIVTIGNVIGGGVLVAGAYWSVFRQSEA